MPGHHTQELLAEGMYLTENALCQRLIEDLGISASLQLNLLRD
jgi:hypothetical protein